MTKRALISLLLLVAAVRGCSAQLGHQKPGAKFLAHQRIAFWGKSGSVLYYCDDASRLMQYDLASGKKKSLGKYKEVYDVSSDGNYVLGYGTSTTKTGPNGPFSNIKVFDLKTGKESAVIEAQKGDMFFTASGIGGVGWIGQDRIVAQVRPADITRMSYSLVIFDRTGKEVSRIVDADEGLKIAGTDECGFVYESSKFVNSYYDTASGKSTPLKVVGYIDDCHYLSKKQLVYSNGSTMKSLDLTNMTVHDLGWDLNASYIRIAPSLDRYCVEYDAFGDQGDRDELYVADVPANAVKIMRQIEGIK